MTGEFEQCAACSAKWHQYGVRRGIHRFICDGELVGDRVWIDAREPLDQVYVRSGAATLATTEVGCLDDQGVGISVASRETGVLHERWFHGTIIERDDASVVHHFVQDCDVT